MTWDLMSFSPVLQSYQDDGRMIMKDSLQWNPVCGWIPLEAGPNRGLLNQ